MTVNTSIKRKNQYKRMAKIGINGFGDIDKGRERVVN